MDVQLRQLQALVAVVDAGTFTDAATVLGVSQAAVSRSIAALEATLGARLLQRSTRHVTLTTTGTRVLAHARRVLDEVAVLRQVVEDSQTELRVGYAWAALGKHTRRLQKRWAAAHPRVPLVFVQARSVTAGLSEGIADVAVIRRPFADARFGTALIGVESRYAAVATDNPLARKRSLRLADLARYTVAIDSLTGTTTPDLWPSPPPIRAEPRPRRVAHADRRRAGRRPHLGGDRTAEPAAGHRLPPGARRAADPGRLGVVEGPSSRVPE